MATLNPTIPGYSGDDARDPLHDYAVRLRRARLALGVLLTPIIMLFVSFTSAYVVRQGLPTLDEKSGQYVRDWTAINLPVRLLLLNTLVLVVSTVTMELARRQLGRRTALLPVRGMKAIKVTDDRNFPWLALTCALGATFLVGQWLAWRQLAQHGVYISTNPSSSFVYLLTVTHAVHLLGGIVALGAALWLSLRHMQPERQYIIVDTASWYWHFMALLWVYVFGLLQFAK